MPKPGLTEAEFWGLSADVPCAVTPQLVGHL